jgi:3-oxoacyl-[acyl-carrier-protein] synthase-3
MNYPHLEVVGTGSYLPEKVVRTAEFENRELWAYDSSGNRTGEPRKFNTERLVDLTGILERRISSKNEWPSDIGYLAAKSALEKAGISEDGIVGIIVATVSERENFPSAAVKIQEKLNARNVQVAYDLQNACAGFPIALMTANSISRDISGDWLVIASECLTKVNDYTDINSHLFGDGAGAVILRPTTGNNGIVGIYSTSEPFDNGIKMIFKDPVGGFIRMPDGSTVLKRAVESMTKSVVGLKKMIGWDRADVYIPHQANERIIAGVEKKLKDDGAAVYRNISRYGNMSSATCAVALDEAIEDRTIKEGSRVIITSFGSGLVTSAVGIQF